MEGGREEERDEKKGAEEDVRQDMDMLCFYQRIISKKDGML